MRAITTSRVVAALATLILSGACSEPFSPPPNDPTTGSLTVVPRSATIRPGQVVALKATLTDDTGNRVDKAEVRWSSSNGIVATVAATGEVFGRDEGFAIITAQAQGRSQTSSIRVLAREPKEPNSKRDTGEN